MRRTALLTGGLVVGLGVLAGCGPEKEVPQEVNLSTARDGEPTPPVPSASEPATRAFVERCLKTATDGHPERVEKGKASRSEASGHWQWPNRTLSPATRKLQAVWPDRVRAEYEFATGDVKRSVVGLRRPAVWVYTGGDAGLSEFTPPDPKEFEGTVAADATGQHWLPMLVPLTDPKAVVFDAKPQTAGRLTADTVKVAVPGCPVFTLWFDQKTNLLGLVTYTHSEGNARVANSVSLAEHKPTGGVMLPTKLEFSRNGLMVEQWNVTAWEFVDKLDDATFERPAEKK